MRGMEMPGFPSMPGMTIEEMPSAASTPAPASETPYTVTSPMSPRTHKVGASEDYKAPSATDSDTSVLLQFKQKHVIPDNIDLDAMSSSFSSDGVLVIKAPK